MHILLICGQKKSKSVPDNFNDTMSRYNEIMLADKTEFEEHM